jgi:hypothetical protein
MSDPAFDGGPAFPCDQIIRRDEKGKMFGHEVSSAGMTLRDHFAAQVLPAAYECHIRTAASFSKEWRSEVATDAYLMADAMLKVRAQ